MNSGDRNTKYFHSKSLDRKKKNIIYGILDKNGNWCDSIKSIANVAISYFEKLYTTFHPSRISEVTRAIPARVMPEMNQILINQFTKEEVETTLKQIHLTKALGPNGMSVIFFQKYWDVIGTDVTSMVLNVLNCNMSIIEINKTNITLVPKTNSPSKMTEYRPISLSNVAYKLISKVLANRLKAILPHIITENQSAFLSKRLTMDNVLVAFELMHYLEHKKDGK